MVHVCGRRPQTAFECSKLVNQGASAAKAILALTFVAFGDSFINSTSFPIAIGNHAQVRSTIT